VGIHGLHRQREWDEVVTVTAPPGAGADATLVVLGPGRIVVEDGSPVDDAAVLAAALRTEPPYRARVIQRGDGRLGIAARRIAVLQLPVDPGGDDVELSFDGVERVVRVDGEPSPADVRALSELGAARFETYVVSAHRLDADLWEVDVAPL